MSWAYLFEAKAIQPYILDSGRLRDMVGASELVDALARYQGDDFRRLASGIDGAAWLRRGAEREGGADLLSAALQALGLAPGDGQVALSRRAGGAFVLHAEEAEPLKRFRALWTLALAQYAPGLAYEHTLADGDDPIEAEKMAYEDPGRRAFRHNEAAAMLPVAGPLVRRSQRTGMPAAARDHEEDIDRATQRKQDFKDADALVRRFAPPEDGGRNWPVRFEASEPGDSGERLFPFNGDRRIVGIVHADGNRMGARGDELRQALRRRRLPASEARDRMLAFSMAIGEAAAQAAQEATRKCLDPDRAARMEEAKERGDKEEEEDVMPARPIVLGGDDLTAIVRGDLAVPFTELYLEAFERLSGEHLAAVLGAGDELARPMTACAGIAFVKCTLPFHLAHRLAEDLCKHAKIGSRRAADGEETIPSSLAFHRVTTSMVDEYDRIRREELMVSEGADELALTRQPYALGQVRSDLPQLAQLVELKKHLAGSGGRGALREAWSLLHSDRDEARRAYRRWRAMRSEDEGEGWIGAYDDLLARLANVERGADWPFGLVMDGRGQVVAATALGDALSLLEAS